MFWRKNVNGKIKLLAVASIEQSAGDAGYGKVPCLIKLSDGTSVEHNFSLADWRQLSQELRDGGTLVGGDSV